jgi:membrane associated rhomboid family serine protease
MSPHPGADRIFGSLALVIAGVFALGALFLFALGWSNDPNDHLGGLLGAFLYVRLICWPGVAAFFLGRLMLRRTHSRAN